MQLLCILIEFYETDHAEDKMQCNKQHKVHTEGCVSSGKMGVITKLIKLPTTQLKMHFLKCSARTRRAMIEFLIKLQFKPAALKLFSPLRILQYETRRRGESGPRLAKREMITHILQKKVN
jgi:hypothetical protein